MQDLSFTDMLINILIESSIVTWKSWIGFTHHIPILFRMKYSPLGFIFLSPMQSIRQYAFS